MTIRNAVLGLAVLFGISLWSWCRPCNGQARAEDVNAVRSSEEGGVGSGGTHDEAAARFRSNQARHWRQVAIGNRSCP
jgi:hypothetical protein